MHQTRTTELEKVVVTPDGGVFGMCVVDITTRIVDVGVAVGRGR